MKVGHLSDKGARREAREKGRNSGEEIERVAKQHRLKGGDRLHLNLKGIGGQSFHDEAT